MTAGAGRVLAVIPARYASRRLPGKALAPLAGRPMIEHVWRRARRAVSVDRLVIATDDGRIAEAVRAFGGEVVLTAGDHPSGTDRVWEVASGLPGYDLVLNVQGDEPLLDPAHLDAVVEALRRPGVAVATVAAPLNDPGAPPSVVRVVTDRAGRALYFSRSAIPSAGPALRHVGLYGFRRAALAAFASRPPGRLERAERLEQLRFLEYGEHVQVVRVAHPTPSVDTPGDLEAVRALLASAEPPEGGAR